MGAINGKVFLTSSGVRSLVDADETVTKFEHVVAVPRCFSHHVPRLYTRTDPPEGDDDELCVLRTILDVVSDDGYIPEVKSSVNLVHEVERCRLVDMQCKHKCERA